MQYKSNSLLSTLLLHFIIIECLLFSGGVYVTNVYFGGESTALVVFFLTNLFHFVLVKGSKLRFSNLRKWFFIASWILSVTFIFGQGSHDLTVLKYILPATSVLLLCSSADFLVVRGLLLRYLTLITILSIFVQLDHEFLGIFPTEPYLNNSGVLTNYTYIFNTEWGESRLASIYWEPGQYQVVIYFVLVLFADEWSDSALWKKNLRKFGILILALLMTQSTTAYILFND